MPYVITSATKRIERDSYEHGLSLPNHDTREWDLRYRDTDADLSKLIARAFEFAGLPLDYVFTGSDDGDPIRRVGANRMENDDGERPTEEEQRRFQAGEITLWLADYEFGIAFREDRGITAEELKAAMPMATIDG